MAKVDSLKVKGRTYYRLVESYRDASGRPRYRVLRYIGNAASLERFKAEQVEGQEVVTLLAVIALSMARK